MNKGTKWRKLTEDNLKENLKELGIYGIKIHGIPIGRFLWKHND